MRIISGWSRNRLYAQLYVPRIHAPPRKRVGLDTSCRPQSSYQWLCFATRSRKYDRSPHRKGRAVSAGSGSGAPSERLDVRKHLRCTLAPCHLVMRASCTRMVRRNSSRHKRTWCLPHHTSPSRRPPSSVPSDPRIRYAWLSTLRSRSLARSLCPVGLYDASIQDLLESSPGRSSNSLDVILSTKDMSLLQYHVPASANASITMSPLVNMPHTSA